MCIFNKYVIVQQKRGKYNSKNDKATWPKRVSKSSVSGFSAGVWKGRREKGMF